MRTRMPVVAALGVLCISFLLIAEDASAVSQWARKEGVTCQVCHQGFPRLNAVGQKYMEDGYTMDTPGQLEDKGYFDTVKDLLGFRLNADVVRYDTTSEELSFGSTPWLQFFVAGQFAKDFTIFIEYETSTHSSHFSWYKVGYHANPKFNVTFGNIAPLDHSSMPDRLRIMPSVKNDFMRGKTSQGHGEAGANAASSRPGLLYYGRFGNLIPYAGISAVKQANELTSPNTLNTWVGARYELEQGSNFSFTYYRGTDVTNGGGDDEVQNDFSFMVPAVNVRAGGFDLQAAARFGDESNFTLGTGDAAESGDFLGYGFDAAYMANDTWQPAINYDRVEAGDIVSEKQWLTVALSYFPRPNIRFTAYYKHDLEGEKNGAFVVMRAMF